MSTDRHPTRPTPDSTVRPTTDREYAREGDNQLVAIEPGDYDIAVVAFVPDDATIADAQYIGCEVRKQLEAAAAETAGDTDAGGADGC